MIFAIKIIKFNYLIKGYRHGRNIAREIQKFYQLTGINNNFDFASTLWIDTNELKEYFMTLLYSSFNLLFYLFQYLVY